MKKSFKIIIISFISILLIWIFIITFDFIRVTKKIEMPLFIISEETMDDGGSGLYQGLGYSVDLEGNFMPDSAEFPGITKATFKLFGKFEKKVYVEYD
jgi:hypothetical protein